MTISHKLNQSLENGLIISKLVKDRVACSCMVSFAAVQAGLTYFGIDGWLCPFRNYLGCPCPGCGLTRATVSLLRGDFKKMLAYHALAPVFLIGFCLIFLGAVLPKDIRESFTGFVERVEIKSGAGIIFCVVLMIYWLVRLIAFTDSYMTLIMN